MKRLIAAKARLDPDALADAAYSRAEAMLRRRGKIWDDGLRTRVDGTGKIVVRDEGGDATA